MQVWTPHHYQQTAMALAVTRTDGAAAIFADPGLGKTSVSYGVISILKQHGMFKRAWVVAPRRPCKLVWPKERDKWTQFKDFTIAQAMGNATQRAAALHAKTDIMVTHYGLLASKGTVGKAGYVKGLVDMILEEEARTGVFPFDVLILDESTEIKHSSTDRWKALKKIAHKFDRRILLTGTPATKGLHDLFGQITITDGGKRLGATLTKFRREYFIPEFIPGVPVPKWHAKAEAEGQIFGKIGDMCLRLKNTDYLDMPELQYNKIEVELPADAMRMYRKVERDYIANWRSGKIVAANAAAAAQKMRQVASGTVYAADENDERIVEQVHTEKSEALLELIEEQNGQPLLVCVAFRSEAAYLQRVISEAGYDKPPVLIGGVSDKVADDVEARWNRGEIPVLIVHPRTVRFGLNLQAGGNALVWYSLTWSLEDFIQSIARIWRQGQLNKHCIVHILCAIGTIDERIADTLSSDEASQERLFSALTEYVKEHDNVSTEQREAATV